MKLGFIFYVHNKCMTKFRNNNFLNTFSQLTSIFLNFSRHKKFFISFKFRCKPSCGLCEPNYDYDNATGWCSVYSED